MHQRTCRALALVLAIGLAAAALLAPPSVLRNPAHAAAHSPVPQAPQDAVRIGLARSQAAAAITAPHGFYLVSGEGNLLQSAPVQQVTLNLVEGRVQVAGMEGRFQSVRLVPLPMGLADPANPFSAPLNSLTFNRRAYRGEIEVLISGRDGRLSVVNVVNMEDYLMGVVPNEMFPSWPLEALKAQAVAARTYAVMQRSNGGKWRSEGFHMVSTADDQAYGGIPAERASTDRAVHDTRGQILTFNGNPVPAYYHSSSGGHTENNEVVWVGGSPQAYLRGVPDFDKVPGNENYTWRRTYTVPEFSRLFRDAGHDVGSVETVRPAGLPGASGRSARWEITGAGGRGQLTITAQQLRDVLSLRSSPRHVEVRHVAGTAPHPHVYMANETIQAVGRGGVATPRAVRGTSVMGSSGHQSLLSGMVVVGGAAQPFEPGVVVTGGGFGHAVGMSQWGAHGMALQGKSYVEILTHYYQGTKVENR